MVKFSVAMDCIILVSGVNSVLINTVILVIVIALTCLKYFKVILEVVKVIVCVASPYIAFRACNLQNWIVCLTWLWTACSSYANFTITIIHFFFLTKYWSWTCWYSQDEMSVEEEEEEEDDGVGVSSFWNGSSLVSHQYGVTLCDRVHFGMVVL